jgi:hypothetical protein
VVIAFLDETPEALAAIAERMRPGQVLLAGSARRELTDEGGTHYYNALLAIDSGGRVLATYDKAHLVPFGEYLPFPEAFRALGIASLTARIGGAFSAGPGLRTLSLAGLPPFGALVCYEVLFPSEVVAPGARRYHPTATPDRDPKAAGKAWGNDLETFLALSRLSASREDAELPEFRKKMIEGQQHLHDGKITFFGGGRSKELYRLPDRFASVF